MEMDKLVKKVAGGSCERKKKHKKMAFASIDSDKETKNVVFFPPFAM